MLFVRTTLSLDDDVFDAARALAESSGKKIGKVISQLARRGLRADTHAATKSGLPVFRISPEAKVIPTQRARDLLAEDRT
ncbi:MAG: hypothetical protein H0U43_05970 [Chthoniobacterales bacterium]|nr:hypothetical protein [Chthoniobacterales bacterium]